MLNMILPIQLLCMVSGKRLLVGMFGLSMVLYIPMPILRLSRELLRAFMQSGQQERAIQRMRELQHWYVDMRLESIVGMAPTQDVQVIWSDQGAPFVGIAGLDVQDEPWSLENKPWTVLAFWATWCAPCKKELPELNAWVQSRSDVSVLAVNVDDDLDSKGVLKALQKFDAGNLTGVRSAQLTSLVGVEAIPTLVLIDSNGVERYRMIGYSPTAIAAIEAKMTEVVPRIQLAQAKNLHVDWYPKPSLKDVLYDGRWWWVLDEQRLKSVSSLIGWLQGTEQVTIDADEMSENTGDRLIGLNGQIATTHNQGKVLRFVKNAGLPILSHFESIDNVYTSEREIWGWGDSKLEVIDGTRCNTIIWNRILYSTFQSSIWMLFLSIRMIHCLNLLVQNDPVYRQ